MLVDLGDPDDWMLFQIRRDQVVDLRRRIVHPPKDIQAILARGANGALEVHVKKPEQSKPRRVPVMPTVDAALPSSLN